MCWILKGILMMLWTASTVVAGTECFDDSDCDDGNPCTRDNCGARTCFYANLSNGTVCNDGSGCTTNDRCSNGLCIGTPRNCDDGNACTIDSCSGGTCGHATVSCNDSNLCTIDSCNPTTGCVHTQFNCPDNNPCTIDSCVAPSGLCNRIPISGGPCDDGDPCTVDDACDDGDCIGDPVVCDDANDCTTDSCSSAAGCVFINNNDPCDDDNECTSRDQCASGACFGELRFGLFEWSRFQDCSEGVDALVEDSCTCSDLDNDGDVDLSDIALYQTVFTK